MFVKRGGEENVRNMDAMDRFRKESTIAEEYAKEFERNGLYIDGPDSLEKQSKKFIKHLGRDSFYELI